MLQEWHLVLRLVLLFVKFCLFSGIYYLKDCKEAKEYIEDIRDICNDIESLCQRNLAANTGTILVS